MKKLLYIVLDGVGDLPIDELGGKTPLESASKPNLDSIAKYSKMGLVFTVGKDIAPESDIAVISILGYDAQRYYTGRGPLESFAEGLKVNDGDLAYRVNFATKAPNSDRIIDRRVGRNLSTKEATRLAEEINKKVKLESVPATFQFKNTIGHRGVLVIRPSRGRLSAGVTNTDPAYEKEGVFGVAKAKYDSVLLKCKPTAGNENSLEAVNSATLTNEFVEKSSKVLEESDVNKKRRLEGKPVANLILTRDAGDRLPKFPNIKERFGINIASLVEMPVERGISLLTGMDVIELPPPTGELEKDYFIRSNTVLDSIRKFDALYIHIKGPDEPAHDGDFLRKFNSIQNIDRYFFAHLFKGLDLDKVVIAVTADHSTPCKKKAHSDDPVPLLLYSSSKRGDGFDIFGESNCRRGSLRELIGHQLMPLLVEYMKE